MMCFYLKEFVMISYNCWSKRHDILHTWFLSLKMYGLHLFPFLLVPVVRENVWIVAVSFSFGTCCLRKCVDCSFYLRFWIILFVCIWRLLLFTSDICNTLSWTFTCERLKCMDLQSVKHHRERGDMIQTHTYTHSQHNVNNNRLELEVETTVRAQIQAEKAEM